MKQEQQQQQQQPPAAQPQDPLIPTGFGLLDPVVPPPQQDRGFLDVRPTLTTLILITIVNSPHCMLGFDMCCLAECCTLLTDLPLYETTDKGAGRCAPAARAAAGFSAVVASSARRAAAAIRPAAAAASRGRACRAAHHGVPSCHLQSHSLQHSMRCRLPKRASGSARVPMVGRLQLTAELVCHGFQLALQELQALMSSKWPIPCSLGCRHQ